MPQIFGCPYCQNPFAVPDNAAGQTFECPSCDQAVEVPDLSAPKPEVYRCPHCEGKFGIDSSMYGQQLACPHCANHVVIGEEPAPSPRTGAEEEVFDVVIEDDSVVPAPVTKKKVRKKSRPKSKSPEKTPTTKKAAKKKSEPQSKRSTAEQLAAPRQKEPLKKSNGKSRRKKKAPLDSSAVASEKVEDPQANESSSSSAITEAPESAPEHELPSVAHLLPPTFDVPDPVRFPHRIGSNEVLLPDGQGGYQTAEANIVTITHQGQVYHLRRMTPEERRRRQLIHNLVAIAIAVLLLFLTLQTIGLFS